MNERTTYNALLAESLEKTYRKRYYGFTYCESKVEALAYLKNAIPKEATIGFGGSRTLEDVGIIDYLRYGGFPHFMDRSKPGLSAEEKTKIQRASFAADIFLTGTNALTKDGLLVNVDKNGNRVAPMLYGPEKVFVVVGMNKVCDDEDAARKRVSDVAAVINNIRFENDTPCVKTLRCMDCAHEKRICYYTTVISHSWPKEKIHVVLVGEELGF